MSKKSEISAHFYYSLVEYFTIRDPLNKKFKDFIDISNYPSEIDFDMRIPFKKYVDLVNMINELTGNSGFFLEYGSKLDPLPQGVKYLIQQCTTGIERIENVIRYLSLLCDALTIKMVVGKSKINLLFYIAYENSVSIQMMETVMANIFCGLSMINEKNNSFIIDFSYAPPLYKEKYFNLFGSSVRFNQKSCAIGFDKEILDIQFKTDRYLQEIFRKHAESLLAKVDQDGSFSNKVRLFIAESLINGNFSLKNLEDFFNLSRQTIYRRLKDEQTTYSTLLYETRLVTSKQLLLDKSITIEEVAFKLGYSDSSAFGHSFRKWIGVSPKEFRNKIR